jgi:hypothetical protein
MMGEDFMSEMVDVHKNEQKNTASKAIPSYMTTAEKLRKIMNMQEIKENDRNYRR